MGFSLKRALAGAIAGGAHAVGQIADAHLREAERQRQQEEAFARQQQLMAMQEEIAMRRDQRVAELKEAGETKKRQKVADFMKVGLDSLREQGLDAGSAPGQRRLAELAVEHGHPELGDKFFDNAIRMDQIESQSELRREEIRTRAEMARLNRESRAGRGGSDEDKDFERGFTYAGQAGSRIMVPDREGKLGKFDNGPGYLQGLYTEAVDNGMSPKEARRLINDTQVAISNGIKRRPGDPDAVANDALSVARKLWQRTDAPPPAQQATPTTAIPKAQPAYTPGIFGSQSQRSGQNTGILNQIPSEGNFR